MGWNLSHHGANGGASLKLYQSFVGDRQRRHVSDACIPHDAGRNSAPDAREYELFVDLHRSDPKCEPWGLISWKFEHKTCVPVSAFRVFCEHALRAGYDCAFINPMIANEAIYANVWEQGEHCGHRGIAAIAEHLKTCAGVDPTGYMGTDSFALSNFFVGTPTFWSAYLAFVDGALLALDEQARAETEIGAIYAGTGYYRRDPSASMRIFVIERLFSSFVKTHPQLRFAAFPHSRKIYVDKFGEKLGLLLLRLSTAKNRALASGDAQLLALWDETRITFINDLYVTAIWNMDDPHELYLGERYQALARRLEGKGD